MSLSLGYSRICPHNRPICPSTFFRCFMSNSRVHLESWTESLIWTTGINRIGTLYRCGSNKEFSSRFCEESWVQHETPEEAQRTYRLKRCDYKNKDEVNCLNILNNDTFFFILLSSIVVNKYDKNTIKTFRKWIIFILVYLVLNLWFLCLLFK